MVATDVVMLRDMRGDNRDSSMPRTLYMVVEHFKNKDAVGVYRRFRDSGPLAPEGLLYVSNWVDDKRERCYQLMQNHDRALLDDWMANWSDLVDFEVHPVITSKRRPRRSRCAYSSSGPRSTPVLSANLPSLGYGRVARHTSTIPSLLQCWRKR
jgi:hypothetical protein